MRGALLAVCLLAGCASRAPIAAPAFPSAGAHLFVKRPLQDTPEPEPFIRGALVALTEELIRSGYDYMGRSFDPEDESILLLDLEELNARLPGTAGIELTFVELPTLVTLGRQWLSIGLRVFGSRGELLLETDLPVPEFRFIYGLVLPARDDRGAGREWGHQVWSSHFAGVFPPRGGSQRPAPSPGPQEPDFQSPGRAPGSVEVDSEGD